MTALNWIFTHKTALLEAVFALQQFATLVVGLLPQSMATSKFWRAVGYVANSRFKDANGTWKAPGTPAHNAPPKPR